MGGESSRSLKLRFEHQQCLVCVCVCVVGVREGETWLKVGSGAP